MFGFGAMIDKLKKSPKTIVLTEGTDPRILEAASRLLASNFLTPILLGNEEKISKVIKKTFAKCEVDVLPVNVLVMTSNVCSKVMKLEEKQDTVDIETIQNYVQKEIKKVNPKVAESFANYRKERSKA